MHITKPIDMTAYFTKHTHCTAIRAQLPARRSHALDEFGRHVEPLPCERVPDASGTAARRRRGRSVERIGLIEQQQIERNDRRRRGKVVRVAEQRIDAAAACVGVRDEEVGDECGR